VSDSVNNVVHDVTADKSYYVTAQKSDPASAQYLQSINQSIISLLTHDKTRMLTPGNTQLE